MVNKEINIQILEEAAEEYSKRVSDGHNYRDLTCGFKAGAEWMKVEMMKEAKSEYIPELGYKVKIIIIPEKKENK